MLKGVAILKEGCALRGTQSPEGSKGVSTAGGVAEWNGFDGMNNVFFLSLLVSG